MKSSSLSLIWLCVTPWTVAHQYPLSMGFSSKNTGVGCHFLLWGIFLTQVSTLQADSLLSKLPDGNCQLLIENLSVCWCKLGNTLFKWKVEMKEIKTKEKALCEFLTPTDGIKLQIKQNLKVSVMRESWFFHACLKLLFNKIKSKFYLPI